MTALLRRLDGIERDLLVGRLTLIVAMIANHGDPLMVIVFGLASVVLFHQERLLRSPWPWLALAALLGARQLPEWLTIDDHPVAVTYWLLALGVSRFAADPGRVLALTARLLIASIFTLAVTWKLTSGQYTSGDFFEYTIVRDDRFEPVALRVAGFEAEALRSARIQIESLSATGSIGDAVAIPRPSRSGAITTAFTWFGIVAEGAVAVAFVGSWRRAEQVRATALLAFCLTTYAVVPIAGFAVLLLTMGLAQVRNPALVRTFVVAGAALVVWDSFLVVVVI